MLIDTHTHLYLDDFAPDNEATVRRALEHGVEMMVFPNVDLSTIEPMKRLHDKFPENTVMAMGLHPTEVRETWEQDLETVLKEIKENRSSYVALGEIGIDLYWDKTFQKEQEIVFLKQAELAAEIDLPIIIHCRDGMDIILSLLRTMQKRPRGVFHCFAGTADDIQEIRKLGDYYFGIGGVVTFKNSKLKELLPIIGADRILLETDSPYLAPVPHRGCRNESAYIPDIAAFIAKELNISYENIADITSANAISLFNLR
ncbi:MAG: TatD family hydrolase [Muribaculaceae bacterium]